MKRAIISLTIFIVAASGALFSQSRTASDAKLKQETFEKVWRIINENFYDPAFNGVDWKAMHDKYLPQSAAAAKDDEFYFVLNTMLKELKVSHTAVISPDVLAKMSGPTTTTGLGLRIIAGELVITKTLSDSSAAKAGLKPGYVLTKVDGDEVRSLEDALKKLAGPGGSDVVVSYKGGSDEIHEAALERVLLSEADKSELTKGIKLYALFESKRLDANVGYIRFTSFIKFLTPRFTAAVESMNDAPGIIIDLRGNPGGDDNMAIKMAGMFFAKETHLMIIKTRNSVNRQYKAKPNGKPYLGPLVILVDELSGSASEEFSAAMQEIGRAYVIGKTTIGQDLDADLVKLPTGAFLLYPFGQSFTPKGIKIEGRGVIPDKEVELTRSSLLNGHDAQLEAAIDHIKSKFPK